MKIIIGNQKNYMTLKDVKNFLENVKLNDNTIICPSNIYLPYYLKNNYKIGLQNISTNKTITGEININQAISMKVKYVIIGHSERRINLLETNEIINNKLKELDDIGVILCIGELKKEKNIEKVLEKQITECLKDTKIDNIIIAYEPVWAIGTNNIPSKEEINKTVLFIKKIVKEKYNKDIKVLYGGSVNSSNIESLNSIDSLDGFLVGRASTNPIEFNKIIEVVS